MTNKDIKTKIEQDFGWLTPDEKQKLNSLMISVWNDAVVASAKAASIADKANTRFNSQFNGDKTEYLLGVPKHIEQLINSLKLKFDDV